MGKGKFITLEGLDGAGKSTHIEWLAERLRARGKAVLVTREPGGTPLGERLRDLLLREPMCPETEALLVFAGRQEHLLTAIRPALDRGEWVVCDRFTDATIAYQGGGRGVTLDNLAVLERWVQGDFQPDLTIFFDVPVAVALKRLETARAADRFEQEQAAFFERVRSAYLQRASRFPGRIRVIKGDQPLPGVRTVLEDMITSICI
jgi:dTMP kinase